MPPASHVFESLHGGQPLLDLDQPLPMPDLAQLRKDLAARPITDEAVKRTADLARRVRASTDRAVFMTDHCGSGLGIGGYCGIGIFPIVCKLEPDYVHEYHDIVIEHHLRSIRAVLPEVAGSVDLVMTTADDWGTQNTLIASPETYRTLFKPYYRRFNDEVHRLLPGIKVFMHNCGAIYDILDDIVESGFDVLNPIQWPAGGHSYREWKDRLHGKAAMWGGGVNAQHTLMMGTTAEAEAETLEVVRYCKRGGGYVFCNIHNLLAEVPAEKVLAIYEAAYTA